MKHHRRFLAVLGVALVCAPATAARATTPVATTAATNATTARAGVIVDEGNGTVKRVGITFSGALSGIAALQLAGFSPTVRAFGGIGGAVCALDIGGTHYGCPSDNTCLTCAAPDYWTYSRAPSGTSKLSTSPVGAGSTTVGDGDIEGWRWGTGAVPTYVPIAQFFPPPPTTTVPRPPTTAPRVTSPGTTTRTTPRGAPVRQQDTKPGDSTTTGPRSTTTARGATTTRPGATTTTRRPGASPAPTSATNASGDARAGPKTAARRLASAPPTVHNSTGSSPAALIVFAAIIAALVIAIFAAHRRRARAVTN